MFRFYILLFGLLPFLVFTQEERTSKCIHMIGGGPQFLASNTKYTNAEYASVNYNGIGYSAFYKMLLPRYSRKYVGITLKVNHREGTGKGGYSGLSSNNQTKGSFSLFRADIGGELGEWHGKRGNFFMGTGIYFGNTISSVSSAEKDSWYINSGSHTETLNNLPILNQYHAGVSFDAIQQIKLVKKNYLIIGITLQLETREVYRSRLGTICNVLIGYKFGRNAVIDNTEGTAGQR